MLGAYLADRWRLWPKLLITSPTRQCGKSTLMEVLEAPLPRALLASNASTAAIFRAIETFKPSLLLDEADTWLRQNEELAGIINSGHTQRTAFVLRVEGLSAGALHVRARWILAVGLSQPEPSTAMDIFLTAFDDIPVLRRRALDVVRRDTSKASLSMKISRAGWDDAFLRSLLKDLASG